MIKYKGLPVVFLLYIFKGLTVAFKITHFTIFYISRRVSW